MECYLVVTAGFEPTTPTPPVWCATRLRYAPTARTIGDDFRRDNALKDGLCVSATRIRQESLERLQVFQNIAQPAARTVVKREVG